MQKKKPVTRKKLTKYEQIIRNLSDRIVEAQKPIRILDTIKWGADIREQFFAKKCRALPKITKDFYQRNPLKFKPIELKTHFHQIEHDIVQQLGHDSGIGILMQDRCREYINAIDLIEARGKPEFSHLSAQLYGSPKDAFYPSGPTINDLAGVLVRTLDKIKPVNVITAADEKKYTARQAARQLSSRLHKYFAGTEHEFSVVASDKLVADAAAGSDKLKLRSDIKFSEREIRMLEVHEGWVHLATTFNGLDQPICTFLSKGPPSSSVTQEGLAVITEIFTFSSYPKRVKKIADRIVAINMAEDGANFLEVFHYFKEQDFSIEDSYHFAARIFRGSIPTGGPFTKDISYGKGFILIFSYLRSAVQQGLLNNIPALFVGKTNMENLQHITELMETGLIQRPRYMPPQFQDMAALSAWMSFSVFMNEIELNDFSKNYREILHPIV